MDAAHKQRGKGPWLLMAVETGQLLLLVMLAITREIRDEAGAEDVLKNKMFLLLVAQA